jgi:hypothetical protein
VFQARIGQPSLSSAPSVKRGLTVKFVPDDLSSLGDDANNCDPRPLIVHLSAKGFLDDRHDRICWRSSRSRQDRIIGKRRRGAKRGIIDVSEVSAVSPIFNLRCSSIELSQFPSERCISILANLLQCCRFGLGYDADLVSEGDEFLNVDEESVGRY